MAVILYKKGNTSKVNGILCEVQICNEFSYLHLLEQGWCYSPEECYAEEKEPELVEIPEEIEEAEAEPMETEPALTDDKIRMAAKDAGISHWHTKSIERLINELDEIKEPADAERSED